MRKHRNEMIRFAKTEEGTLVWFKCKSCKKWNFTYNPEWDKNTYYIVDDEYADLRIQSINTGRKIQVINPITHEWETPSFELEFGVGIENYRLEPEQFNDDKE